MSCITIHGFRETSAWWSGTLLSAVSLSLLSALQNSTNVLRTNTHCISSTLDEKRFFLLNDQMYKRETGPAARISSSLHSQQSAVFVVTSA